MPKFVHLCVHTEYSVTDGIVRIDPMLHAVHEAGAVAVAVTDRMNIFGGLRFYTHALSAGIKPILGCDLMVRNPANPDAPFRLPVYCMNHDGYHSLSVLLTKAFLDAKDPYRGQIEVSWLEGGAADGLIALTGGTEGEVAQLLLNKRFKLAREVLKNLSVIFGDRLYVEVQRAGREGDELAAALLANLAVEEQIPIVATHPVQFLSEDDFEAHEVRCAIADGYSLSDPRRIKKYTKEQYLKSEEEMCRLFADIPAALENTIEIAKRCSIDGVLSKPQLPLFPTPGGMSLDDYIDQLSKEGLQKRLDFLYPDKKVQDEVRGAYDKRLEYELGVIKGMKFPGYFLIVQDFINWSKNNGVPVGPGRGSGAGSLVAYSLGITDLDPLKFDLLFERFLNPERVSMPDFDIDFCQYNRDRTIEYVKKTYGVDAVSQIATFGTMGAKAAIRDVGRVLDMPYSKADALSKLVPAPPGKPVSLEDAYANVPEFKEAVDGDDEYKEVFRLAKQLEGITRNLGMHAGGVLIAPGKLSDFCPLYNADGSPENTISQFDKKDVENVGLVKFDFLGLTTLSILTKAVEYIDKLNPGTHFDLDRIPIDDHPTYELFQKANTVAVFQFESPGMRNLLKQAKPDRLEDLVALNALYRPGPMDLIPSFINRKFGREKVEYLDPRMEPVLNETYGIMVYQEQVMRVAQEVGGYTLGGADLLRRAMGKKNVEEMHRQREVFIKGAAERGVKADVATEIFDLMEKFAGYGFNKSHAAAYSYVAYQTAYLKAHHPAEFLAANLCMVMDQGDKMMVLLEDAAANGVGILFPDINKSDWFFTAPDAKTIRFGLGGIKGMSQSVALDIMRARQEGGDFIDIFDFAARVKGLNTRIFEGLVKSGCFDSIDPDRGRLYGNISQAISASQTIHSNENQDSLFSEPGECERIVNWVDAPSWSESRKLQEEKKVLGFWLTSHPFAQYKAELENFGAVKLASLKPSREPVRVVGIVRSIRSIQTKRGFMGVLTIDDGSAVCELVCYSSIWDQVRRKLSDDCVVCATAKARKDDRNNGISLSAESVSTIDEYRRDFAKCVVVEFADDAARESVSRVREVVSPYVNKMGGLVLKVRVKRSGIRGDVITPIELSSISEVVSRLQELSSVKEIFCEY